MNRNPFEEKNKKLELNILVRELDKKKLEEFLKLWNSKSRKDHSKAYSLIKELSQTHPWLSLIPNYFFDTASKDNIEEMIKYSLQGLKNIEERITQKINALVKDDKSSANSSDSRIQMCSLRVEAAKKPKDNLDFYKEVIKPISDFRLHLMSLFGDKYDVKDYIKKNKGHDKETRYQIRRDIQLSIITAYTSVVFYIQSQINKEKDFEKSRYSKPDNSPAKLFERCLHRLICTYYMTGNDGQEIVPNITKEPKRFQAVYADFLQKNHPETYEMLMKKFKVTTLQPSQDETSQSKQENETKQSKEEEEKMVISEGNKQEFTITPLAKNSDATDSNSVDENYLPMTGSVLGANTNR